MISNEEVKNELLLSRLKAMSIKNKNRGRDLILNDIEMIKICVVNLWSYFGRDEEKKESIKKIDEEIKKIVESWNSN
jgi:hypothetical protein